MNTTLRAPRADDGATSAPRHHLHLPGYWAAAFLFSACVVLGARAWYAVVQALWPTVDGTMQGLQFGSFLLVLGAVAAWRRPGLTPVGVAHTLEAWRVVVATIVLAAAVTWAFVATTESNAYSDADALFEIVLVPVGEEVVFRGVLLGLLLEALRRRLPPSAATRWAVVIAAVAFGSAHISNALFGAGEFALVQVLVATVMGLVLGALRIRTGSLIAPILVHAVINGMNLLG